jgi:hypothetical protein
VTNADKSDQQFGRLASEKQEEADAMAAKGEDPATTEPEGEGEDPRPRAGSKASDGAPPQAGESNDEEVAETFPASDPPANY